MTLISSDLAELQEAAGEPAAAEEFEYVAGLFKALGDRNRQKILYLLREGEMSVSDLLPHFDILQPTVSTHLLLLEEAGVLRVRREGRRRLYRVADPGIYEALDGFVGEFTGLLRR